jgi:hypothetical protein
MDSAKLNDWLQVIGIFALVASLVFVGLQLKQTQEIGQGEAASYYLENINSFRNTIIENAEVWRNGCMDEELSDGDQTRFAQMYAEYLSTAFWTWVAREDGVLGVDSEFTINAFAANIHRYPGIAKIIASRQLWAAEGSKVDEGMSARFRAAVQTRLAELKEIEPEPLSDPQWCGNLS